MATLNSKEKLICKAAEGNDPFLGLVFKRLLNHRLVQSSSALKGVKSTICGQKFKNFTMGETLEHPALVTK